MTPLALVRPGGGLVLLGALGAAGLALGSLPGEVGPLAARAALGALAVLGVARLWRRGARTAPPPTLAVTARAGLGRSTGVALVEVDGRRLLLGVSEDAVELLCELEPAPPGGRP